jgi:hypothetical protein
MDGARVDNIVLHGPLRQPQVGFWVTENPYGEAFRGGMGPENRLGGAPRPSGEEQGGPGSSGRSRALSGPTNPTWVSRSA